MQFLHKRMGRAESFPLSLRLPLFLGNKKNIDGCIVFLFGVEWEKRGGAALMKKIVTFMKKWLLIPFCCFLLFFPAWIFGMMIGWIFGMMLYEMFGFGDFMIVVGMLATGGITSIPIIYKVRQSERMEIWVKRAIITLSVLFFAGVAWWAMIA